MTKLQRSPDLQEVIEIGGPDLNNFSVLGSHFWSTDLHLVYSYECDDFHSWIKFHGRCSLNIVLHNCSALGKEINITKLIGDTYNSPR